MRLLFLIITVFFLLLGNLLVVKNPAYAASPWEDLWTAVQNLQDQVGTISTSLNEAWSEIHGLQAEVSSISSISYYQIHSTVSTLAPGTFGHAEAHCHAGDTVVGGGYDASAPIASNHMIEIYTNIPFGVDRWAVAGFNSGLNTDSQNLSAFAVCSHNN